MKFSTQVELVLNLLINKFIYLSINLTEIELIQYYHSMYYIIATLLRKAFRTRTCGWKELMLVPDDYDETSLQDPLTRRIMQCIEVVHGGAEYDDKYPDGIPTSLDLDHAELGTLTSGLVMYPAGHARNATVYLDELLHNKFNALAALGVDDIAALSGRFSNLGEKSPQQIAQLFQFDICSAS